MEKTFGEFLKEKRQEKKLTQKELAQQLFVSESAVSKWEKDVAHPDITLLPKLSSILNVTEHELITASVDKKSQEEKQQAKKWRTLRLSWNLFFQFAYIITMVICFICNLATEKTLSWFWIVLSAILLSFTFTNLPTLIKKHKLLILPASMYGALVILLSICAIYTNGNWLIVTILPVLFCMIIVFVPIYISKYKIFNKIRKFNDFISVGIDFLFLNLLLITIDYYTTTFNYSPNHWYLSLALPISFAIYLLLNLFMSVRFLKLNKLFKTSLILFMINLLYCITPQYLSSNIPALQPEIDSFNIFKANFSNWKMEITIQRNIHAIIFLTILSLSITFFVCGLIKHAKSKTSTIQKS